MTGRYEHVCGFAYEHPWALTPSMRALVAELLARRHAGQETDPATIQAALAQQQNPQPRKGGGVAVIPIYGVIAPRMNMLSEMSGGTTFEALTGHLRAAVAHKDVGTIIFDVNSGGGNIAGATEFAAEVRAASAIKPIVAVAEHLMASAAYWPMAYATKLYASPSALVGAIGVYHIHDDVSAAQEKLGLKREVIAAGKFKAEGADGGPLSEDGRAHIQALVGSAYRNFVRDVAKGRGVTEAAVRNGFGEGRVVDADTALELGMVNGISTLAAQIARYAAPLTPADRSALGLASAVDTPQEPSPATGQDRQLDVHRQRAIEASLFDSQLAALSGTIQ